MNRGARVSVERVRQWLLVAVIAATTAAACVDVNGGAVELSWSIRSADGQALTCDSSEIARVRLTAASVDETGERVFDDWPCDPPHGTTLFNIREGRYSLTIEPLCADRSIADATVPPPIVRDIVEGEVAQLNALLIVVQPQTVGESACGGTP